MLEFIKSYRLLCFIKKGYCYANSHSGRYGLRAWSIWRYILPRANGFTVYRQRQGISESYLSRYLPACGIRLGKASGAPREVYELNQQADKLRSGNPTVLGRADRPGLLCWRV